MDPMFPKIACSYVGTYILFSPTPNTAEQLPTRPSPLPSNQQQSDSTQQRSHQSSVPSHSLQHRPSANASSTSQSTGAANGQHRTAPRDTTHTAQPTTDYDSDDSQVKKKIKVASLDWQGQTFYVTGKESALNILRETYSVRTLMEEGQIQLLVQHVGDYVNNYTADVFKMGTIRRHSKSALLAGMNLTVSAHHDLDHFQAFACFHIKELQDNL
jgi:DNA mismatch repair ATPase MutL